MRGKVFSGQPLSSLKKGTCQATKAVNIGRKQVNRTVINANMGLTEKGKTLNSWVSRGRVTVYDV